MRVGDWIQPLRISVKRAEERPDNPQGDIVYRVKDLFTTRDGSWEPRPGHMGAVPQWARDAYLRPWSAPDRFDDAGGDHHLFARVLDLNGKPVTDQDLVLYWSDGFHRLGDANYRGYARMTPKQHSGWANLVMSGGSSYVPERNEHGPWCWCPRGAADVVVGGGMPANHHISIFAVWQAEQRGASPEPGGQSGGGQSGGGQSGGGQSGGGQSGGGQSGGGQSGGGQSGGGQSGGGQSGGGQSGGGQPTLDPGLLSHIREESWRQVRVAFNRDSSFARYARERNLGAPLTNEYDIGNHRAQGFAGGIVYAVIGQWDRIQHVTW
jgi:hypothetical protein